MATDVVAEIKRRLDPVEYIGKTVRLEKSGRNFRGLCPFHTEKTPSFYVFTDRGSWRCFGSCGEGGDLFTFVQKRDGGDFREALRSLAEEAGVELSARAAERRSRSDHLAGVVSAAVDFYRQHLLSADGEAAMRYLRESRGLAPETIDAFHIGWAPDDWRDLRQHLAARGYSDADAIAAGMLVEPEGDGQPYDRFRGRVIVPIADERGVFVALGGRAMGDAQPKYLNSPQTEIFDKGRTLYGVHGASDAIKETGVVVVVEGYMDVIGPWQAGFRNVVATMGTSLTAEHAEMLGRRARRVVLAMDPDTAGMNAAERAGSLFVSLESPEEMARSARSADQVASRGALDLRVAPLPSGKDPDDLARESPSAWARAIEEATPYTAFLLDRIIGSERPESGVEARRVVDRLVPVLRAVADPVERALYLQRVARRLGVGESAVAERLRSSRGAPASPRREERRSARSVESILLATAFRHPGLRHDLRNLPPDLFTDTLDREAFRRWQHAEDPEAGPDDDPVVQHIRALAGVRQPVLSAEDARRKASDLIRHVLRDRLIQRQITVTEELATAERTLGTGRVEEAAHAAWIGEVPGDDTFAVAQTVMEEMELGLSIHRREGPSFG